MFLVLTDGGHIGSLCIVLAPIAPKRLYASDHRGVALPCFIGQANRGQWQSAGPHDATRFAPQPHDWTAPLATSDRRVQRMTRPQSQRG